MQGGNIQYTYIEVYRKHIGLTELDKMLAIDLWNDSTDLLRNNQTVCAN